MPAPGSRRVRWGYRPGDRPGDRSGRPRPARIGRSRALLVLLVSLCALLPAMVAPGSARAQGPALGIAPEDGPEKPVSAQPAPAETSPADAAATADRLIQYEVQIDAPSDLAGVLRDDLDLIRWRTFAGMNRDLLERLTVEAQAQLVETLATEGYFSPSVVRTVTGDERPWTVRFEIDPGPVTRVREVRVEVVGTLFERSPEQAQRRVERITERWPLPEGARFRQRDWDLAKRIALEELVNNRFAGASIRSSRATIDPASREAVLEIVVDSGPVFRYGPLLISGLSRFPESMVRNLATFRPGQAFDDDDLVLFQRRLTATGQFSAVQVELDTTIETAAAAPVRVSVLEANTRRVEAGVGYSTDTLYRVQFGYTDNDFLGRAWRWRSDARFESRAKRASSTITLPARADGWQHAYALRYDQSDIAGLDQQEGSFALTRTAIGERRQPQWALSAHVEEQRPAGGIRDTVFATFLGYRYTWRDTDDLLSPTRGTMVSGQIGIAPPGLSTRTFTRAVGQAAIWIPIGRSNTLVFHAEGGALGSSTTIGVPQSFLFRTGGDTSIRGYAFETIGIERGAAVVGGRFYAVASAEAVHWVSDLWGLAAFYDVGNVANRVSELSPLAQGIGAGVRVRSPLGPIRIDLAYGERTKKVRLHLSLGVNF